MPIPILGDGGDNERHQRAERREAQKRSAPSGGVVYGAIYREGEAELSRSTSALWWSGVAAGLSMGFTFAVEGLLGSAAAHSPWQPLISKFGYSVGFLIVVLGRQQLFTENTLTVMLPLLNRRDRATLRNVARLWVTVFLANVAGADAIATVFGATSALPDDARTFMLRTAGAAVAPRFGTMVLRGVFAGWLIALMVWLLPYAEAARFWVVTTIAYVIGIGGFPHVIAGSIEAFYLVVVGHSSVPAFIGGFLAPALLGNIIGGVSLVAALAHAQFNPGEAGPTIASS